MAWAPMTTTESRCSWSASKASNRALRAWTRRSASPDMGVPLHPFEQCFRLRGVAPRTGEQVDHGLAGSRERNAIHVRGPVVNDVIRAGRQQHVGPDLNLSQSEPVSELVGVVDVDHGRTRRRVWRPVLGGDRTCYRVTQICHPSEVRQQSGEPSGLEVATGDVALLKAIVFGPAFKQLTPLHVYDRAARGALNEDLLLEELDDPVGRSG